MLSSCVMSEQNVSSFLVQNYNQQLVSTYLYLGKCKSLQLFYFIQKQLIVLNPVSAFPVVICGPPPIPNYGKIVYDIRRATGERVEFGVRGTYKCVPPMALIGNPRAECTSSGTWTVAPVCRSKKYLWKPLSARMVHLCSFLCLYFYQNLRK